MIMTTKEKAAAYDMAIERTRRMIEDYKNRGLDNYYACAKESLEKIFPELKESEDERIKYEIIGFVVQSIHRGGGTPISEEQENKWIAWLEKQGEKPTDKVEPKFKVGDWVVRNGETLQISGIDIVLDGTFHYWFTKGTWLSSKKMENAMLWTIQDAKDGDVLCYKDEISLYKHDIKNCAKQETTFGGFVYHCCYDGKRFIMDSLYSLTEQDKIDIHPATKEQRDTLMKAITDAGYTFDFDKKELKRIEQNKAWRKEDEEKGLLEQLKKLREE